MAQPTGTFDTFDAVGVREDISNVISRIDPQDTPFTSNIGKGTCNNTYFEWQTQALAAAAHDNAHIQGDVNTATAVIPTARVGGRTQIFKKTVNISATTEAVDKAGRGREIQYQKLLKGVELKRDREKRMIGNYASVTGDSSTAYETGGLQAWIETSADLGAGATEGGFASGNVVAHTMGTPRAFTEALLKTAQQSAYSAGGKPTILSVGPAQKVVFSSFTGLAETRINNPNGQTKIVGGADIYIGDFGSLTTTVNLFQDAASAILIDPKLAKIRTLRGMTATKDAPNSDGEQWTIVCEEGLEVTNEAGHALIGALS